MPIAAPGRHFQWEGEVSDYAEAFGAIRPSLTQEVAGTAFLVPSRDDYATAFMSTGDLAHGEDLAAHAELIAAAQAHWHTGPHNACVFAAHMSKKRKANGWESYVVGDNGGPDRDAETIHAIWSQRLFDPSTEIVSVILPHGDDAGYLAQLLRRLETLPSWELIDKGQEADDLLGPLQKLGLLVNVEFEFRSEVLGFGPHAAFANTRQAPFPELAIRAKPPRKRRKDKRAFMAQVDIPGLPQDEFGIWWDQTKANRASRVGADHDDRAKARVTFAIPASTWEESA